MFQVSSWLQAHCKHNVCAYYIFLVSIQSEILVVITHLSLHELTFVTFCVTKPTTVILFVYTLDSFNLRFFNNNKSNTLSKTDIIYWLGPAFYCWIYYMICIYLFSLLLLNKILTWTTTTTTIPQHADTIYSTEQEEYIQNQQKVQSIWNWYLFCRCILCA